LTAVAAAVEPASGPLFTKLSFTGSFMRIAEVKRHGRRGLRSGGARAGANGRYQHIRDIRKSEIGEKDHVPTGSETRTAIDPLRK
jgi:hypothetical protein